VKQTKIYPQSELLNSVKLITENSMQLFKSRDYTTYREAGLITWGLNFYNSTYEKEYFTQHFMYETLLLVRAN
jgi:hypothetical protein